MFGGEQRLETLKRLAEKKETDPACWNSYAAELMMDARRDTETLYWLKRTIRRRRRPRPHGGLSDLLVRIRMEQRKFDECAGAAIFRRVPGGSRRVRGSELLLRRPGPAARPSALQLLQKCFQRFGAKSSQLWYDALHAP